MKQKTRKLLVEKLSGVEGVKNVKIKGEKLAKINLYSREKKGTEAEEIQGDLRSISQNIRRKLEECVKEDLVKNWNWVQKPEKQYLDTSIQTQKVEDRKPIGHKPSHYLVSFQKK